MSQSKRGYCHKFISHLVLLAFVGPRPKGLEVAHLNGDSTDDRLVNLKYCTHIENESHKRDHGTAPIGELNGLSKLQSWQVEEIRYLAGKSIPQGKIAALFDVDHKLISEVLAGKNWAHVPARTDVPKLLNEVERLRAALVNLRQCEALPFPYCESCERLIEVISKRQDLADQALEPKAEEK